MATVASLDRAYGFVPNPNLPIPPSMLGEFTSIPSAIARMGTSTRDRYEAEYKTDSCFSVSVGSRYTCDSHGGFRRVSLLGRQHRRSARGESEAASPVVVSMRSMSSAAADASTDHEEDIPQTLIQLAYTWITDIVAALLVSISPHLALPATASTMPSRVDGKNKDKDQMIQNCITRDFPPPRVAPSSQQSLRIAKEARPPDSTHAMGDIESESSMVGHAEDSSPPETLASPWAAIKHPSIDWNQEPDCHNSDAREVHDASENSFAAHRPPGRVFRTRSALPHPSVMDLGPWMREPILDFLRQECGSWSNHKDRNSDDAEFSRMADDQLLKWEGYHCLMLVPERLASDYLSIAVED